MVESLPIMWETRFDPGWEKEMAIHSSIAWKIPWTEEPGGLQSAGLQRGGHNRVTGHSHNTFLESEFPG